MVLEAWMLAEPLLTLRCLRMGSSITPPQFYSLLKHTLMSPCLC